MLDLVTKKIQKLEQQQVQIQTELIALNQQRNAALIDVLKALPPTSIDPSVLIGGLLFVLEEHLKNPQTAARWQQAGQKFLRRGKGHASIQSPAKKTESPLTATAVSQTSAA